MEYTREKMINIAKQCLLECGEEYFNHEIFNIELFIEKYLGLELEYKDLMTNEAAKLIVDGIGVEFVEEQGAKIKILCVPEKTILINTRKTINKNEAGLRFSLAHEASHWILHKEYSIEFIKRNRLEKIIEKEANFLAAELLMPTEKFICNIEKFKKEVINKNFIKEMAKKFNVSKKAVLIKIRMIMKKEEEKSTQNCEQGKEKKERVAAVNKKSVLNQQLSYKITNEYLDKNRVYENTIYLGIKNLFEEIVTVAKEKEIEMWKVKGLLDISNKISQVEPYHCIYADIDKRAFYSFEKLNKESLGRINLKLLNQIKKFIELNKEYFSEKHFSDEYFDSIVENYEELESKEIKLSGIKDIEKNKNIIKAQILRELTKKVCKYKSLEEIEEELNFKLCTNVTEGLEIMSEIKSDKLVGGKFAWVIQPKIQKYGERLYFEPKIIFRRFVTSIIEDFNIGAQFRSETGKYKQLNRTIFIEEDDRYLTVRIVKDKEKKGFKKYYKDYYAFEEIEKSIEVSLEHITKALTEERTEENRIFISYHTSMNDEYKGLIKSGIPSADKASIHRYITESIPSLKTMRAESAINIGNKISKIKGVATDNIKFNPTKAVAKFIENEINLYIFRSEKFRENVYEFVVGFFEYDKNKNLNIEKIEKNKYKMKLQNKELIINIIDVMDESIVGRKRDENEEFSIREAQIKKYLKQGTGKNIALIQIENLNKNKLSATAKFDAKKIIRDSFDSIGMVNQFIIGSIKEYEVTEEKEKEYKSKVHESIFDLLNDIGIVNGYANIENKVIYSFIKFKIDKEEKKSIPFIIRTDERNIEFMALEGSSEEVCEWRHISNATKSLSNLKQWIKTSGNIDEAGEEIIIEDIIDIINDDIREKIIILSHENNFNNDNFTKVLDYFENASIVKTSIVDTELIQLHKEKGHTGITTCVFKMFEKIYRSNGEKMKGVQQKSDLYKNDLVVKEYKHRKLMDIEILKSNMEDDVLAELIHRLRVPITTNIHLNKDFLTEHLMAFSKHLK
ncbi:MAG: ImmA/IrrE family metallo-endopeptidase [Clostridium sp.]